MKPTEEQIKKFWEWCELKQNPYTHIWFIDPNTQATPQPTLDLNSLFRWAVPKCKRQISLSWNVWDKWKADIQKEDGCWVYALDENPTLALFWAIYKAARL